MIFSIERVGRKVYQAKKRVGQKPTDDNTSLAFDIDVSLSRQSVDCCHRLPFTSQMFCIRSGERQVSVCFVDRLLVFLLFVYFSRLDDEVVFICQPTSQTKRAEVVGIRRGLRLIIIGCRHVSLIDRTERFNVDDVDDVVASFHPGNIDQCLFFSTAARSKPHCGCIVDVDIDDMSGRDRSTRSSFSL